MSGPPPLSTTHLSPLVSNLIIGGVGLACKAFLRLCTHTEVHHLSTLLHAIRERPPGTPLITVSNHTSTLDDPLLWGVLPTRILFDAARMRWALGAEELLFTNGLFSWFFGGGRVLAIRRGDGLMQPNVSRAVQLLNEGNWVHIFPEGRVIPDSSQLRTRLRWGVSRLILEPERAPLLLPIVHEGMERVKPLDTPFWRICLNQRLRINIGPLIDTDPLRKRLIESHLTISERRSQATTFVASQLAALY